MTNQMQKTDWARRDLIFFRFISSI